ncbi:MAG: hypothetical protein IIA14_05380 [SAR324 cluster bacterium]|nr:hypothetical protein [SAR324 cluster bacterium]
MAKRFPYDILADPKVLAGFKGWSEEVYRDFLAQQRAEISEAEFRAKYQDIQAILIVDMTGFTESAMNEGIVASLLRIFDVQKVCAPVLMAHGANHIRAFADDLTATFSESHRALDAALEIHDRVRAFNDSDMAVENPAECCIGLGYGPVLRIGPDNAMGDEMNRASKLGEDTAKGGETLLTEAFFVEVKTRGDCSFELRSHSELPFPFYAAKRVG